MHIWLVHYTDVIGQRHDSDALTGRHSPHYLSHGMQDETQRGCSIVEEYSNPFFYTGSKFGRPATIKMNHNQLILTSSLFTVLSTFLRRYVKYAFKSAS